MAIINRGRVAAVDSPERLKQTLESVQAVQIALDRAGPESVATLRGMAGVTETIRQGDKWRLCTADPPALLPLLFDFARRQGLRIITLNTLGPSLESVASIFG